MFVQETFNDWNERVAMIPVISSNPIDEFLPTVIAGNPVNMDAALALLCTAYFSNTVTDVYLTGKVPTVGNFSPGKLSMSVHKLISRDESRISNIRTSTNSKSK